MANILIIDDSLLMRKKLTKILTSANHVVVGEANDGIEGLKKYKELSPDIVTLDITMPNMDGLECLKEILAFDSNAKIIMMSALSKGNAVTESIKTGAKDFLSKPFEKDQVIQIISNILT